jgi:hypothetical protein
VLFSINHGKHQGHEEPMADELAQRAAANCARRHKNGSMTVRHFSFVRFVSLAMLFSGYSSYIIEGVFNGL